MIKYEEKEVAEKEKIKKEYFLIYRITPYLPKISYSSSAVILYGKFLTKIILLTSGGSLI